MPHEYDDPVSGDRLDQAARLTLRLRGEAPSAELEFLAACAVGEVFCSCITGAEDTAESGPSAIHGALVGEVIRRARQALERSRRARIAPRPDPVERASRDSFPASDPPAWIWRQH